MLRLSPWRSEEILGADFEQYQIPGTPTRLLISYQNDKPIGEADMQQTLLQTRLRLRQYLRSHWQLEDEKLLNRDDPYRSDPRFEGYATRNATRTLACS